MPVVPDSQVGAPGLPGLTKSSSSSGTHNHQAKKGRNRSPPPAPPAWQSESACDPSSVHCPGSKRRAARSWASRSILAKTPVLPLATQSIPPGLNPGCGGSQEGSWRLLLSAVWTQRVASRPRPCIYAFQAFGRATPVILRATGTSVRPGRVSSNPRNHPTLRAVNPVP